MRTVDSYTWARYHLRTGLKLVTLDAKKWCAYNKQEKGKKCSESETEAIMQRFRFVGGNSTITFLCFIFHIILLVILKFESGKKSF